MSKTFNYRILIVDDEPLVLAVGAALLEAQGYEIHCAEDGLEGLAVLKRALPDIIISDLRMPNMNGFEFLSVVRRRFPMIPVIVMSGEFLGCSVPESILADAFFSKGDFRPPELFLKIIDFIYELPTRPKTGKSQNAAVWVKNGKGTIAVTCSECLRTFPVSQNDATANKAECDFCLSIVRFEFIGDDNLAQRQLAGAGQSLQTTKSPDFEACGSTQMDLPDTPLIL